MIERAKLGKRLECSMCGIKFYDLNRKNPKCPKCQGEPIIARKLSYQPVKSLEIESNDDDDMDNINDDLEILPLDEISEAEMEFAQED